MNQLEISFGTPLRIIVAQESAPQIQAVLTLWYESFKATFKGDVMYTLQSDHAVKMQVSYVDANGHPAAIDGPVTWVSSDATMASVQVDKNDTTICVVAPTPNGVLGQVQVTATADADLGQGVRNLITVCDIQIVAGEAVAGVIQPVGDPTPIGPEHH